MKGKGSFVVFLAILLLGAGAAMAQNQDCSCTGVSANPSAGCGNGGIGGAQGDIFVDITAANVSKYFGAGTGWTCVVPSKVNGSGGPLGCYCANLCGNGGIGADPKTFNLGLSQSTINSNYGGGKAGNRTGWLCGSYRGSFNPAKDKVKPGN